MTADGSVNVHAAVVLNIKTVSFIVAEYVVAVIIAGGVARLNPVFNLVVPKAPEVDDPKVILVVDPEAPPVPRFIAFVVAVAVALVKILAVIAVVGVPPIAKVVTAPPKLIVVAVVFIKSKDVDGVVMLVVIAGLVPNTNDPEPVSSVIAVAKLEDDGVVRNVAIPVPKPDTPVEIGRPVALVKVPDAGVPSAPPEVSSVDADGIVVPFTDETPGSVVIVPVPALIAIACVPI